MDIDTVTPVQTIIIGTVDVHVLLLRLYDRAVIQASQKR